MAFSILYWMNFVSGTKKLHQKSEVAVKSEHVLKFVYDPELQHVQGRVQANMRDRSYHVNVQECQKTDVRASWIQHPQSLPPKRTQTMEELFPPPPKLANYRAISRPVEEEDVAFL